MNVYMYQAALLCEDCGAKHVRLFEDDVIDSVPVCVCGCSYRDHKLDNHFAGAQLACASDDHRHCEKYRADETTYESDEFPKGPFYQGGGEADCPQHCDECGTFLENPLTTDGYAYVASAIVDALKGRKFDRATTGERSIALDTWAEFYDLTRVDDLISALKGNGAPW